MSYVYEFIVYSCLYKEKDTELFTKSERVNKRNDL
jgi:hypothetical protein